MLQLPTVHAPLVGQDCVLQLCELAGFEPVHSLCSQVTERVCVPPPQLALQAPQLPVVHDPVLQLVFVAEQ